MTRHYIFLPSDDVVIAAFEANGRDRRATAAALGVNYQATCKALVRLGIRSPRLTNRARAVAAQAAMESTQRDYVALRADFEALERRVAALEARPATWRPDNRRIVDGGAHANAQRRLARAG